jgi:hypothetical protein
MPPLVSKGALTNGLRGLDYERDRREWATLLRTGVADTVGRVVGMFPNVTAVPPEFLPFSGDVRARRARHGLVTAQNCEVVCGPTTSTADCHSSLLSDLQVVVLSPDPEFNPDRRVGSVIAVESVIAVDRQLFVASAG